MERSILCPSHSKLSPATGILKALKFGLVFLHLGIKPVWLTCSKPNQIDMLESCRAGQILPGHDFDSSNFDSGMACSYFPLVL